MTGMEWLTKQGVSVCWEAVPGARRPIRAVLTYRLADGRIVAIPLGIHGRFRYEDHVDGVVWVRFDMDFWTVFRVGRYIDGVIRLEVEVR